jgi:glycosyltransferase involved in cell wall biosynthesis
VFGDQGGLSLAGDSEAGVVGERRVGERRQPRLRLSAVLPAFNEEANIERAVAEVTAAAGRLFEEHEVIVVDDGSTDGTAARVKAMAAKDPRVRLISHGRNRGYGDAVRTGFLASRLDFVFMTDADLQFDPQELERLLPYAGTVDVVAGYRISRQDTLMRRLNAYGWNLMVRIFFYVPVRDIDCAFKLFDRRVLDAIDIESVGAMVNTEVMVKVGRAGASVVEVGVPHRPRLAGKAHGAHPRVILWAFYEFLRMRKRLTQLDGRML